MPIEHAPEVALPVKRGRLFWDPHALDKEANRLPCFAKAAMRERLFLDVTLSTGAVLELLTEEFELRPLVIGKPSLVTTNFDGVQRRGVGLIFEHKVPVPVSGSTVLWKLLPERGFRFPIEGRLNTTGSQMQFRGYALDTDNARFLAHMDEICDLARSAATLQAERIDTHNELLPTLLSELVDCHLERMRKAVVMRLRGIAA